MQIELQVFGVGLLFLDRQIGTTLAEIQKQVFDLGLQLRRYRLELWILGDLAKRVIEFRRSFVQYLAALLSWSCLDILGVVSENGK